MSRDRFVWMLRVLWAVQPITSGPAFALAIDTASRPVALTATVGLWLAWTVALAASLMPLPTSLVVVRLIAAAAPVTTLAVVAAIDKPNTHRLAVVVAVVATTLAAGVALSAPIGDRFVDGASYGDERRMLLRPSVIVMSGPIVLAGLVAIGGIGAGPLLLAAQKWWWAGAAFVLGVPASVVAVRALYGLTQRWIVFVPAGVVLRDPTTLAEPVLFRREGIVFIGPALADTNAADLTGGAGGLALEMRLVAPTALPIRDGTTPRSAPITPRDVAAVLFAPSRPGEVLDEAFRRKLVVQ